MSPHQIRLKDATERRDSLSLETKNIFCSDEGMFCHLLIVGAALSIAWGDSPDFMNHLVPEIAKILDIPISDVEAIAEFHLALESRRMEARNELH